MPTSRPLQRLAENGAAELAAAFGSITDAARAGTGLAVAMASMVTGDVWKVVAAGGDPGVNLRVGDSHSLGQMLCSRVIEAEGPVSLPAADIDDRGAAQGIGCYAGVPLRRSSGEIFGTLAVAD